MHTYTPTASHDPVVEFDTGDLGNQTNLNNMVRALGNRTQLAKETNDTQNTTLSTLQTQMLLAYNPAVLTADLTLSASGPGPYTSGEEFFALASANVTGADIAGGLAAATYTGTGGGVKLVRLAPNSRYLVHMRVLASTPGPTSPAAGVPAPEGNEVCEVQFVTADNTALSVGLATVETVRSVARDVSNSPSPYTTLFWDVHRTLQISNTAGTSRYMAIKWLNPVLTGTIVDYSSESVIVVQRIGTV